MRKLYFILALFFFASCNQDMGEMSSANNDSSMVISLKAKKFTAEPMKVSLSASLDGRSFDSEFEIFSNEFNNESVDFNWKSNRECEITFEEWDESPKKILVQRQATGLLIKGL